MDLIEDYLKAVGALLPRAQRDDIVAELRDMILTRIEAREEDLGRRLAPDEIEAVLREIGHPLVVAARYGEGPQHVVGPMLYPYWLFGVKVVLAIQAAAAAIAFLVGVLAYGNVSYALGRAVGMGLTGAATLIGFATAAAWIVERSGIHIGYLDRWRVKDLRVFSLAAEGLNAFQNPGQPHAPRRPHQPRPATGFRHPAPAARGVALIAWGAVLILWWSGGLHILGAGGLNDLRSILDPGPLTQTDWSALKAQLYWPILAYILALMVKGAVLFAWPQWRRLHGLLDVLTGLALLGLVTWLWRAPALAPSVQVDSVAAFAARTFGAFVFGPPFPLPAILTLILVCTAFGGVIRVVGGLLESLVPGGRSREGAF